MKTGFRDLEIEQGELVLIGSRSGAGKSTFVRQLARQIRDSELDCRALYFDLERYSTLPEERMAICRVYPVLDEMEFGDRNLIIVDSLQMVLESGKGSDAPRVLQELKKFAMETGAAVIVTTQLSRMPKERTTPSIEDLACIYGSEGLSDKIMLLSRPDYHDPTDHTGMFLVDMVKNRNGESRMYRLRYDTMV